MHSSGRIQSSATKSSKKPFFSKLFGSLSKKKEADVSVLTLGVETAEPLPKAKKKLKTFQNRIAKWVSIKKSTSVDSSEIFATPPTNAHMLDADQDLLQETQPLYASSIDDLKDELDAESNSGYESSSDSLAHNQRRVGVYIPSAEEEKSLPWETTYDSMISHLNDAYVVKDLDDN